MRELYEVSFWYKKPKSGSKDLDYAFFAVTQFSDPETWEALQKIFKRKMKEKANNEHP